MGRPSTDTPEVRELILKHIAEDNKTLSTACRMADRGLRTVQEWMEKDEVFRTQVKEAQEFRNAKLEDSGFEKALSGDPQHNNIHIFLMKTKRGLVETSVVLTDPKPLRVMDIDGLEEDA